MFTYAAFSVTLILLILIYKSIKNYRLTRGTPIVHATTLPAVQATLAPPTGLRAQLEARAAPNARLMRAFGIHSTFTTDDPAVHRDFTRAATGLITHNGARYPWYDLAATARIAIEDHLPQNKVPIAYDTYIQITVLRTILKELLGADPACFNNNEDGELALTAVAFGINQIWAQSKVGATMPRLLECVNSHLACWLPYLDNPIELVIPVYETMWRVVAITVAFANVDATHARPAFERFMGLPDSTYFRYCNDLFSVEDYVREVLRLYPPTRHIARLVRVEDIHLPFGLSAIVPFASHDELVKADVEAVQRDRGIWGPTAEHFDPTRFRPKNLTEQQARAMLAFGHGPLSCVAKNWAPQAAAVLAGAVLERVGGDSEFELVQGPQLGGREGWNGWLIREVSVSS